MKDSLYHKEPLVPLTQITDENVVKIRIGEDFVDLARLGMIGEYTLIDSTELCPKLYYRWSYQFGEWEIYATEHDLIRYNLIGVSSIKSGGYIPPEPPTPGPDPEPSPDPEPDPDDYKVKLSSPDSDWEFNGAIITFKGLIKWYPEKGGHYVPVRFKIGSEFVQYLDSLVVTYRGAKYDKTIFDANNEILWYISVRVPGQIVPIRFDFTDELHAQYFIKIADTAKFETPYNL